MLGGDVGRSAKLNLPCSVCQHVIHVWTASTIRIAKQKGVSSGLKEWETWGCGSMTHGKGMENVNPARR